jgi:hypothetical protein
MLGSIEIRSCGIGVVGICEAYTDKKENEISLIHKEILTGSVAKLYMGKSFLINEELCKKVVHHI